MPLRLPRSFPLRLALWAGLLVAALGAVLTWSQLRVAEDALLAHQEQRLRDVQAALRSGLSHHAVAGNWQAAVPALRRLRGELGLSYLVLQDAAGRNRVAVGMGVVPAPPDPSSGALQALAVGGLFHGSLDLPSADKRAGVARFGLSLDALAAVRSQSLAIGAAGTLAALVVGAGVTLLAAQGFTRRIRRVQHLLADVAQGGPGRRLPAHGPEEAAALARSANAAVQALTFGGDALAAREARFHAIAEWAYGIEAWFSPLGRLVWINRSIERVTGYTPLECVLAGNLVEMLVYQKDRRFAEEEGRRALAGTSGDNLELRLQRKDGSLVWVAVTWQAVRDARGRYLGLRVSLDDIQGRKEAEMQLLETVAELRRTQSLKEFYLSRANDERARLGALLDVMKIGVLFVDRDRRVLFCNKALYRIWNVPERTSLTGLREDMLLARTAPLRCDDTAYRRHVAEVLKLTETSLPYEFTLVDGRVLMEISTLVPGDNPEVPIGRMWIYEDVTEQKRIADRLIQLAERDPLTNLYNRRRFHEELDRMLADAARREVQLGLLVVDLDGFKPINDRYGHQAGDTVLVTLADEVGATVRRNEMFFRVGGDEFAILATDSSEEDMIGLARRILARITALKFNFAGDEARLTASVGIALYPEHGASARELVDHGDQAMYRAKSGGKNGWQVWQARSAA